MKLCRGGSCTGLRPGSISGPTMIPGEVDPRIQHWAWKDLNVLQLFFYCLLLIFQLAMPHTTHIHATPLTPINAEDHRLRICFVVVLLCAAFPCDGSMQMFKTEFSRGSESRKPLQPCPRANPSHTHTHGVCASHHCNGLCCFNAYCFSTSAGYRVHTL